MGLLSFRAYARHRGVSLGAVQKAIKSGRIQTTPDEKGKPKIDPDEADRSWASRTDPTKQGALKNPQAIRHEHAPPASDNLADDSVVDADDSDEEEGEHGEAMGYYKSKAQREKYQAKMAKLKYRQAAGELVEVKEIQENWQKIATTVKTRLLGVPSRVRARVPHLTTADIATIEEEIRDALSELAEGGAE